MRDGLTPELKSCWPLRRTSGYKIGNVANDKHQHAKLPLPEAPAARTFDEGVLTGCSTHSVGKSSQRVLPAMWAVVLMTQMHVMDVDSRKCTR